MSKKDTETAHLSVGRGKTEGEGFALSAICDVSCAAQNLVANGNEGITKKESRSAALRRTSIDRPPEVLLELRFTQGIDTQVVNWKVRSTLRDIATAKRTLSV